MPSKKACTRKSLFFLILGNHKMIAQVVAIEIPNLNLHILLRTFFSFIFYFFLFLFFLGGGGGRE